MARRTVLRIDAGPAEQGANGGRPGSDTPRDPDVDGRTLGLRRRRALPGGRAVVGGFLVAVAAVVVFAIVLTGSSSPGQPWLVATHPLAAGAVIGPGDVAPATMRLAGSTASIAFHQPGPVEGRTLAVGLQAGELLQGPMLVPSSRTPALRPVSIAVNPVPWPI